MTRFRLVLSSIVVFLLVADPLLVSRRFGSAARRGRPLTDSLVSSDRALKPRFHIDTRLGMPPLAHSNRLASWDCHSKLAGVS